MTHHAPPNIRILESLVAVLCIAGLAFLTMSPNVEVVNEDPYLFFKMILSVAIVLMAYFVYEWLESRIIEAELMYKTLGEETLTAMNVWKKYALGMETDKEDE